MITQTEQQNIASYLKGANEGLESFADIVELLSTDCTAASAKVAIKQKMKKVFTFAKDVFGSDELAIIAKPYFTVTNVPA